MKLLPARSQVHDAMSDARNAGYSWPQINSHVATLDDDPYKGDALNDRLSQSMTMNLAADANG